MARQLRNLALLYLTVLLVLLFLENKLIFRPVLASEDWESPPNALVQDIKLQVADGTRIHGWWCPVPGWQPQQGAMLYCHGNAGNLPTKRGLTYIGYPFYNCKAEKYCRLHREEKNQEHRCLAGEFPCLLAFCLWLVACR